VAARAEWHGMAEMLDISRTLAGRLSHPPPQAHVGAGGRGAQGLLTLRGGSDDTRSRRRLVKGRRSLDLPPGFFGKPLGKDSSADQGANAAGEAAREKGNPFAPSQGGNPFAPSADHHGGQGAAQDRGSIFGGGMSASGSMFGASSVTQKAATPFAGGGNPFGGPAAAGNHLFPPSQVSSAPAGFVASPFGVQPAATSAQPNFGFGGARPAPPGDLFGGTLLSDQKTGGGGGEGGGGAPAFGFSGSIGIGAAGETLRPAAGKPFNPFAAPSAGTLPIGTGSLAPSSFGPTSSATGRISSSFTSIFGGVAGGGVSPFANLTASEKGGKGWSSPLLGSSWGGIGGAGGVGGFNVSGGSVSGGGGVSMNPFGSSALQPSASMQQQQQQQQQPGAGGFIFPGSQQATAKNAVIANQGPVAISINPFQDLSTQVGQGAAASSNLPALSPWGLGATGLNNSAASFFNNPFGVGLAQAVAGGVGISGTGISGTRIERGKPIFDLSGVGGGGVGSVGAGLFGGLAQPPQTATATAGGVENGGEEYTGIVGEGETHDGEFLGLAKGGGANFGFIKPAAPAGGGGGSGNIFVHKSNIKHVVGTDELGAGQPVRYRLAPHEAPSSPRSGMDAGGDTSRVQAVEVEACVSEGGSEGEGGKGMGMGGSHFGEERAASSARGREEWRCDVCMVTNKGEVSKCVCCEGLRPIQSTSAAPSGVSASASIPTAAAGFGIGLSSTSPGGGGVDGAGVVAAGSGGSDGFQFPISVNNKNVFGRAAVAGVGKVVGISQTAKSASRRRRREEEEDTDEEDRVDTPVMKRRGMGVGDNSGAANNGIGVSPVNAEDDAQERERAVVPRVFGSPRLLSYS